MQLATRQSSALLPKIAFEANSVYALVYNVSENTWRLFLLEDDKEFLVEKFVAPEGYISDNHAMAWNWGLFVLGIVGFLLLKFL